MRQFSIRNLLFGTFSIAVLMAFIAQEPIGVSLAAMFCVVSWLGILYLCYLAIGSLVDAIGQSYRSKRIDGLAARFRWAYVDGLIATWMFFTIVISNFVLENSVANARYLIFSGWTLWLIGILAIAGKIIWQRRSDRCATIDNIRPNDSAR